MAALDKEQQAQVKEALKLVNFIDFDKEYDEFKDKVTVIYSHIDFEEAEFQNKKDDIIMRVINYLYSGFWDLNDEALGTTPHNNTLKAFGLATLKARINKVMKEEEQKEDNDPSIETEMLLNKLSSVLKVDISIEINDILTTIKTAWLQVFEKHNDHISDIKSNTVDVSKILVYEAPPYQKAGDTLNYLLLEGASGPYVTAIKKYFSDDENVTPPVSEILNNNNILFFDLLMIPIPLSSDVRKMWLKDECFLIDRKPLPVYLFEMNLEYLSSKEIKFANSPVFAIGTPHLTALPIFKYYSKNKCEFFESLRITNDIDTRKLDNLKNLVLPLFKACFVNASNNPDGALLKHALSEEN